MRIHAALATLALGVAIPTVAACSGGSSPAPLAQSTSVAGDSATGTSPSESATATATAGTTAAAAPASGGIAISCSALNAALPAARIAAAVGGTPSAGDPDLGGCQWFLSGPTQDGVLEIHSTTAANKSEWLDIQTVDPDPTHPSVKLPDVGGHTAYWEPTGSLSGGLLTLWDGVKEVDLGITHPGHANAAQLASDQASLTMLANDLTKK